MYIISERKNKIKLHSLPKWVLTPQECFERENGEQRKTFYITLYDNSKDFADTSGYYSTYGEVFFPRLEEKMIFTKNLFPVR